MPNLGTRHAIAGTVGLTLGYGSLPYSFCGVWKDGSKMVLLFIMILGKHRYTTTTTPPNVRSSLHGW
jgi:Trk-type K+ transport system membrane component